MTEGFGNDVTQVNQHISSLFGAVDRVDAMLCLDKWFAKETEARMYTINLVEHLAECDANYHRLTMLMHDSDSSDSWQFGLRLNSNSGGRLSISVKERCPYTTTVSMTLDGANWQQPRPCMTVRIYHDAQMAEVIAYQKSRRFESSYAYPNKTMYHPDEKEQLNRLLGEWLSACIKSGHVLDQVAPVEL
jgi:uncharacterized protein YqiB (DUF1249 family)